MEKTMANYIVRGILIGGSLGVFAGILGIVDMGRGAALGMIGGFFCRIDAGEKAFGFCR